MRDACMRASCYDRWRELQPGHARSDRDGFLFDRSLLLLLPLPLPLPLTTITTTGRYQMPLIVVIINNNGIGSFNPGCVICRFGANSALFYRDLPCFWGLNSVVHVCCSEFEACEGDMAGRLDHPSKSLTPQAHYEELATAFGDCCTRLPPAAARHILAHTYPAARTHTITLLFSVVSERLLVNCGLFTGGKGYFCVTPEELEAALDVSKDEEFCIKNEEFCIKNEKFCIKNEELCIENDEFCRNPWRGARTSRRLSTR